MQRDPLILTFDCGTQSMRAMLFDKRGNLTGQATVEYKPYFSPQPGWAEQHPDFYFEKLCEASLALKGEYAQEWSRIAGVTITTMRDTAVCLDRDYNVLRPSILWLDDRQVKCSRPLPFKTRFLFRLVGMLECANASRENSKSNWIREYQPEIWEKTDKYVLLSCYMIYRLTGNLVDSVASQVGHIPFEYPKKRWMKPSHLKYWVFPVEREKLPELVEPGEELGRITRGVSELTGIPEGMKVIASGSDKGCETLGSGCIAPGMASLSFGTTCTVQLTLGKYVEPQQYLPAYPAVLAGMYNPEVEIYRGYWMVTWFKEEFAELEKIEAETLGLRVEQVLDKQLSQISPGSNGLMLQPYWGPGLKTPEAKGAIMGFSDVHTRLHIYRAIIEGMNYALRDGMETMLRRAGCEARVLTVSGGGSKSDAICQITADMFNRPVCRAQTYETAGLGSSIAGFVGLGEFSSMVEAAGNMVRRESVFEPDASAAMVYDELYHEVYLQLYHRLKPIYQKIRRIYGRHTGES